MEPEGGITGVIGAVVGAILGAAEAPPPAADPVLRLQLGDAVQAWAPSAFAEVVVETGLSGSTVFVRVAGAEAAALEALTTGAAGTRLAIAVCGAEVSDTVLAGALRQGSLRVARGLTEAEAMALADLLRGTLPCPDAGK